MNGWITRCLIAGVRGYRLLLSPSLGNACRFEPTCSVYAIGALAEHGAAAGTMLALARIARCHPWCSGGHDPVPPRGRRLFTSLMQARPTAGASEPLRTSPTPQRHD